MVGAGSSCGACKFLRRKCEETCVFAPYFNYDKAEIHFAAVHKVFGASNVSKLLSHLPIYGRAAAAITISYEAQARIRDPVRGCISHILALQQQVVKLQEEIECLTMEMAMHKYSSPCVNEIEENVEELQPSYKEAMDRLEDCLFRDEPSAWEELAVYVNDLEIDLLY